ncbi:hypothetical protein FOZ62_023365 [Perkinsus olseni]|nr:hypothetical protein FOZ62_023365 [Perkinsus olseni]
MLGFISSWLIASQSLLLVAAQDPGKYVHSDPGGAFTIMFDLKTDNRLTFVFEVFNELPFYDHTLRLSGGPQTYSVLFTPRSGGVHALYGGIRTLYRNAKIQPGDLATLTYDEVQNTCSASFQGRNLQFVKWSFPLAGAFEHNRPGAFRWRYHIHSGNLVDITLSCPSSTRPGGPGPVHSTFRLVKNPSEGRPIDWLRVEDVSPADRRGGLDFENFLQAYRATCPYPNQSDADFKAFFPFSPNTVYVKGVDAVFYPLVRVSYFLLPGAFRYTRLRPSLDLTYGISANGISANGANGAVLLSCTCTAGGRFVSKSSLSKAVLCHTGQREGYCLADIPGQATVSDLLAFIREECGGPAVDEGSDLMSFYYASEDTIHVPYRGRTIAFSRTK